jgi:uncharacterized secreted protein with C-terminal beta-propeller domain
MFKNKKLLIVLGVGIVTFVGLITLGGFFLWRILYSQDNRQIDNEENPQEIVSGDFTLQKFKGVDDFKEYINNSKQYVQSQAAGGFSASAPSSNWSPDSGFSEPRSMDMAEDSASSRSEPSRYSETNVQVSGIDEPDIVKTDGQTIFFSSEFRQWGTPVMIDRSNSTPGAESTQGAPNPKHIEDGYSTQIINGFPVKDLEKIGDIEKTGNLLLVDDILVVLADEYITAYDVSDPQEPQETWNYKFEDQSRLVKARLYEEKIYIVAATYTSMDTPCPVKVLAEGENKVQIPCNDVYHPKQYLTNTDEIYSVLKLDSQSGEVTDKTSFIGSSVGNMTTVYMSYKAVYVGYYYLGDMIEFMANFIKENSDFFPDYLVEDVDNLVDMDISQAAKMTELQTIMEKYTKSLSDDEQLELENEMQDRMEDYYEKHKRELEKTGIVKVPIDNLSPSDTGVVPGKLLNQFSMDEYEENLRVATTTSGLFGMGNTQSENDVYVLAEDLDIVGYVQGMGLDEQIYSVRFMGEMGYVVTFKQIDPFYVLNLSDPKNPEIKGELKIPGFSSYLHPLQKDIILGVGEEKGKVKVALFDVSDPTNPQEKDKYIMSSYWSEIASNHHAFLQDEKYQVFFIPTNKGGNIFSYAGDEIELVKSIAANHVKRALFIDDYLYIIGMEEIVVLEEGSWEEIKSIDLSS